MAFNKIARKDSDFYVICTLPISAGRHLLLLLSHRPSLSRSLPTSAVPKPSPKTYASTASLLLSLKPVRRIKLMAMKSPFLAVKG